MKRLAFGIAILLLAALLIWAGPASADPGSRSDDAPPAAPPPQAPAVTQDFQDVATNSTFYTYTHNLYNDGVVSGYQCGSPPAGPCVPPGNLPYFLPGNGVTRGQNSKFEDLGRRRLTGAWNGSITPYLGIFSAVNTDTTNSNNTGLYGVGATGVRGDSYTTGATAGYAGLFVNHGSALGGPQYAVYAAASAGVAVHGEVTHTIGVGGEFIGFTGAALTGTGAGPATEAGDGLEVSGGGNIYYAIRSYAPSGDTNYTLFGEAHIRGTNITAGEYELEAVYEGVTPIPLGRVVALDPNNTEGGPLGVVPAGPDNEDAAIGVLSFRLDAAKVNGVDKTYIDATATEVNRGDHVYIGTAGRVKMHLDATAKVGTRLAVGPSGTAVVAPTDGGAQTFGKVASRPAPDGTVDVIVNFK